MKALTICQPYAHLILTGEKPVENRTWRSDYYGPLLIHAGKSREWLDDDDEQRYPGLVFGAVVGRVVMHGSLKPERYIAEHPEHADSEHVNGPWCFVLSQPERFERPIPYRGQQGFFEVPESAVCPNHHYRAAGYCPHCKTHLTEKGAGQ